MTKIEHAQFVIERTFGATAAQVFTAWKDPEAKRRWFAEGEGFTTRTYELDFREGGSEHWIGDARNGMHIENNTHIFDITDNARIAFAYAMTVNGQRISASLATVELFENTGKTRFVYTEQAAFFDGADGPDIRKAGWEALIQSLADELARNS